MNQVDQKKINTQCGSNGVNLFIREQGKRSLHGTACYSVDARCRMSDVAMMWAK